MKEKLSKPLSGYIMLLAFLAVLVLSITAIAKGEESSTYAFLGVIGLLSSILMTPGFFFVNPNNSRVLVLFGDYKGTVKTNGFYWTNPFYVKKNISLRARNFDSDRVKVNDKLGNPIMISVIAVWRVKDTFKAAFDVDNYESFVRIQSDSAVRKLAGMYPYDNFDDHQEEVSLRSGMEEVNHKLEEELSERLEISGIEVLEARIGYLAYASEIASAMLKRQQAEAVIAARFKIVEGAVSMVEMALEELSKKQIVELDEDKKATMVSNLMIILCSDKEATPVLNTGTLNQ